MKLITQNIFELEAYFLKIKNNKKSENRTLRWYKTIIKVNDRLFTYRDKHLDIS